MGRLAEICHANRRGETTAGAARIMSEKIAGVGIIGCGVISAAYLKAARLFPQIEVRGLADLDLERAKARSAEFGPPARTVTELLADPAVDIVLNLTTPAAHLPVALQAIAAGKHVYGEKPLAVSTAEARRMLEAADAAGVRVGCAPDTFLGGGHQSARRLLDDGAIGTPVGGTAFLMLAGHERWHPDPDFYYARAGGGPMFDMGPYYLTDLVQLLGPVAEVVAFGTVGRARRVIAKGPRAGSEIAVDCTSHVAGLLRFEQGAIVQIATSFEVWAHKHTPIELYGTEGSLAVPDPNRFGGEVELCKARRHLAGDADHARLCRRQLSHPGPRRHGGRDRGRPAASGERCARLPRARGDGGARGLQRGARHRPDREPLRAAGADAGRSCDRRDSVRGEAG